MDTLWLRKKLGSRGAEDGESSARLELSSKSVHSRF